MVAKTTKQKTSKPGAWIVSTSDKGRKSIKNGKCYLKNNSVFEIELFNPLQNCILADIKLNGKSISKNGLVLKPGQRFYLDCFIDSGKKFIFNTYDIENSTESIEATSKNGLLEVFFYKESVITLNNWSSKFDKIIIEKWYPYPWIQPYQPYTYPIYYGNTTRNTFGNITNTTYNSNTTLLNTSSYSSSINLTKLNLDNSISEKSIKINNSIETGRVEKGETSSQKFNEIDMDFENYYIASTILTILPESRKPIETKEIKKVGLKDILERESDETIELIKKLSDLHKAGILTDDEFSNKKIELLSKI